jgi:arabinofuranosyltransferase
VSLSKDSPSSGALPAPRFASALAEQRILLLLLALLGWLAVQATLLHDVRLDDAYVTFRYAQNLATGAGLVFNPGHRVMGSTSPGEVLLAAIAYALVGRDEMPSVMALLGTTAWMAGAACLYLILRDRVGGFCAGVVAAGIAAGVAGSAEWVVMETHFASTLALCAILLGLGSRWIGAAAVCVLAAFFRPDAYLAAVPLAVLCVRELRLAAWRPAVTFAALAAPWPIFAALYFGSSIPRSAIAKYHQTTHGAFLLHILGDVPSPYGLGVPLVAKVVFWLAAVAGAAIVVRADRRLSVLVAYALLHGMAYVVLAPDPEFRWHLYPLTLCAFVFVLVAVATATARLSNPYRALSAAGIVALCTVGTLYFDRTHAGLAWWGQRDAIYRRIADYLSAHADPSDIVDSEEVGTFAYYTGLRMNDHARLVTPYPGDVFWRLTHGRPTKLRWLVLNGAQLKLGRERPFYEGRAMTVFDGGFGGWRLWVVDVKAPRIDGQKSPWEMGNVNP